MNIEISDFKNIPWYKYTLPPLGLILIEGKSGCGKTTLVSAIQFCLTGANRTRITNKKPKVTIEYQNVTIMREKNPSRLLVQKSREPPLVDLSAQAWIDHNLNCMFISQHGHDSFFTATRLEKRRILEQIVGFEDENTIRIENTLVQNTATFKNVYKSCVDIYEYTSRELKSIERGAPGDLKDVKLLEEKQQEYIELQCRVRDAERSKMLAQKQQEARELSARVQGWKERCDAFENSNKYYEWLDFYNSTRHICVQANMKRIEYIQGQKYLYQKNIGDARLAENTMDKYKNTIGNCIIPCPYCTKNILVHDQGLSTCDQQDQGLSTHKYENKRKRTGKEECEYSSAKKYKKLPCEWSRDMDSELSRLNSECKLLNKHSPCDIPLNLIDRPSLIDARIRINQDSQDKIRILVLEEVVNQRLVQEHDQDFTLVQDRIEIVKNEIVSLQQGIKLSEQYDLWEMFFIKCEAKKSEMECAAKNKCLFETGLTFWKDCKNECIVDVSKIIQVRTNLYISSLFEHETSVVIDTFKKMEKDSELFRDVPTVDIQVIVDKRRCSLEDLSGGEKSRISIAFSCTMCDLKNMPFLFLDETLSCLDEENMALCLKFLKKWSIETNTSVVIIAHQAIKGFFGQVISIL